MTLLAVGETKATGVQLKRPAIIALTVALVTVTVACQPAPPPPPPARVTLTATTDRDVEMGWSVTNVKLRGAPGCDARIIERRLDIAQIPTSPFGFSYRYVLRAGSQLVFTVPGNERCWKDSGHLVNFNGKLHFGPEWYLDVPFDADFTMDTATTLKYYDGLTVVK